MENMMQSISELDVAQAAAIAFVRKLSGFKSEPTIQSWKMDDKDGYSRWLITGVFRSTPFECEMELVANSFWVGGWGCSAMKVESETELKFTPSIDVQLLKLTVNGKVIKEVEHVVE